MDKTTLLVDDDDCTFIVPRDHMVAHTSQAALDALHMFRATGVIIDELWLDYDLGGDDTTLPVLTMLSQAAAEGEPYPVRQILVHSMNRAGADTLMRGLRAYGYATRRVALADHLIRG